MTQTVIWTVAILAVLGLLLALVLFWVASRFKVEEDPRIDEVEKVMPGANCGGCGFAGCRAFADSAVKAANLDGHYCPVGGDEVMQKVASILGLTVAAKAPQVAVVRCNGSCANRPAVNSPFVPSYAAPQFNAPQQNAVPQYAIPQYQARNQQIPAAPAVNEPVGSEKDDLGVPAYLRRKK